MKSNFFKLSGIYAIGNLFQSSIQVFLLPLMVAYLTTEEIGAIALIYIISSVFITIISSPISTSLNRYYYHPKFSNKTDIFLFNLVVVLLIKSLLFFFVLYYLNYLISDWIFKDGIKWSLLLKLYSLLVLIIPLSNFFKELCKITEKAKLLVSVRVVESLIYIPLSLLFFNFNLGVYSMIYGQILSVLFTILVLLIIFYKNFKPSFSFTLLKRPFKYSYPLMFSDLSQLLYDVVDRYILKGFVSLEKIGVYDLGYKVSGFYNALLGSAISQALPPIIYKEENSNNKINLFIKKQSFYYLIIGMWFWLLISLFCDDIINFFLKDNHEYKDLSILIPILLLSNVMHVLGYFLSWGIILKEKSWTMTLNMFLSVFLNITLNFLLIPIFGILGAALATLISCVFWNCLKAYFSKKFSNFDLETKKMLSVVLVAILLFIVTQNFSANNYSLLFFIFLKAIMGFLFLLYVYFIVLSRMEKRKIKTIVKLYFKS